MRMLLLGWGLLIAHLALATEPPAEALSLGQERTPLGGERAGNADGSIPPWRGPEAFSPATRRLTAAAVRRLWREDPEAYTEMLLPDPGQLQYVVSGRNAERYAQQLTAGHRALLDKHESYALRVYPARRYSFVPDSINEATRANVGRARLIGSDIVEGASMGTPFPFPRNGAEIIWNHRLRYRGGTGRQHATNLVVRNSRSFITIKFVADALFRYANTDVAAQHDSLNFMIRQKMLAPARAEGVEFVMHEHRTLAGRQAWMYRPGSSTVKRMPEMGYDTPNRTSGGLVFIDQQDMFNGPLDRYDWRLIGKREMLMPGNSVRLGSPLTPYAEVIDSEHMNPELARYEPRRVWIVEAELKEGQTHSLARRRFYVDEDSWIILAVDNYDARGRLWRFQEAHAITLPFAATAWLLPAVYYDLDKGRYVVQGLFSEEEPIEFDARFPPEHFSVEALQQAVAAEEKPGFWNRLFGS